MDTSPNRRRSSNVEDMRNPTALGSLTHGLSSQLSRLAYPIEVYGGRILDNDPPIPSMVPSMETLESTSPPVMPMGPWGDAMGAQMNTQPVPFFQRQRATAANMLFGDPLPNQTRQQQETGGGSPYGASARVEQSDRMNNPAQTARAVDEARRGTAPLTAEGIAAAVGNATGIVGSGGVTTGLKSIGELAMGMTPGSLGGFSNIPGHTPYSEAEMAAIRAGTPISRFRAAHQAQYAADRDRLNAARGFGAAANASRLSGGMGSRGGFAAAHGGRGGGSRSGAPQGGQSGGPRGY